MARITIGCNTCTVDGFGKYACEGRLAYAVESEEYIAVVECLSFTRILENFFHKILTDDIGEILGTIGLVEGHFLSN